MAQFVIDTGVFPNDGTGDPLRTAFEYVNLNFDQIFTAGPVLSNIEIVNNTIYSINTNGNIVLNPNGIGNVIANAHVIPDTANIRNLGAQNLKWNTVYAQYLVGDGNGISNISAANISNGTARVDAYFNGNVTVTANGVANVAVFTVNGLVVPNTVQAGTVSGNIITTNISGQSITISATGNNQSISLAPSGTGNVSVNFRHIVNLAEPVNPQDAATKYYVDSVAEGLDVKASCLLATTAVLPTYVYNNGSAGVGATITGNTVGLLSIDSTAVTAGARVLVKNEAGANEPYNGIYVVVNTGNATATFQLIRSTDFDNGAPSGEIPGAFTFIETGTVNADSGWVCTTNNPVTVGTTPIYWAQFSGAGSYTAGLGLNLVGGVFNALVDNNTTEINLSNQIAVKAGANLVTPNIGAATGTSLSVTGAVTANSINTSGAISTTANIVGGNILTTGVVSATNSITGGNIATAGFVTATGEITSAANVIGANFNTSGKISAAGNVTGGNIVTVGNVTGGNLLTDGSVSAAGNIVGNNVSAANTITALTAAVSGNVESGNIVNSGTITSTGNITGGNIRTAGQITVTGNATVGNIRTAGLISAGGEILANGNISGANLSVAGIVTAVGNIVTSQYFIGNGAFLTGIDATSIQNGNSNVRVLANANVTVGVAGVANVAVFANSGVFVSGIVTATGNISGANVETGNVTASGNVTAGNILSNNLIGSNVIISSTGNITLGTTGNINVGNTYITNLANPVNLQDAATKFYVDTVATGLDPKESVVYATANVLGVPYTYNNGASGVGATLTANLPGALTIDGNLVQSGQRVLIKNETGTFVSNTQPSAAFNGIYDVAVAGNVSTAWSLTRSADFNQATEMVSSFTFVETGTTNADTGWVCVTNAPVTVGFTEIIFTQFSGAGSYLAGNGLSLNGTVFNVNTDGNIAINGNNQVSIANSAVLNSPNITTATATSLSATGNVTAGNILFGTGIVSGTGNIYANKIFANIVGNVDAAGNLTEIQFNTTGDQLGATANFTYDSANNVFTVAGGNIVGGNITTVGTVTATGNVFGSWFIGNVNATIVSATANVVGGNILTVGEISAGGSLTAANISANNFSTSGVISAAGNITGGNIDTTGLASAGNISTTGNVDAGNVLFGSGIVSGTGNIYANKIFANIVGNIDAAGNLTEIQFNSAGDQLGASANFTYNSANNVLTVANGNIVSGNVLVGANISAVGNVHGSWFVGNVDAGTVNASANITGGNVLTNGKVSATGTGTFGNVLTGGIVSATSTIQGGNVLTPGEVSATGSLTGGNIFTGGTVSAVSNVTGGNLVTGGQVTATGTVTGGNVVTAGFVSAVGDVTGGNVVTAGFVSATGTGTFGNISTAGTITATGNITGNYFFGNGSQLTGIDTNLIKNGSSNVRILTANGNISMDVNGTSNVVVVTQTGIDIAGAVTSTGTANVGNVTTTGFVSATGNVTGGNVNTGSLFSSGQLTIAANASGVIFSTTGNVNVSNVHINNLADPVQAQDAATKAYVDAVAEGLVIDAPAEAATPNTLANISVGTITYNNGNAGIGATLVTTGTYTNIDGVNIATVGTRILVKDEANLAHNGIYTYANSTALVRATDYDQPSEITGHDFVFVVSGNTYAGTGWVNIDAVTTVGTDPIEWFQFSGAGTIQAGNGIAVNGTQVNVLTDGITTGINGSNQIEIIPNAQLTTPNIGAATGSSLSVTGNIQSANLLTSGVVTATGTVTAGNISTGGFVSATGNIGGGNILTAGLISATGTITSADTITGGNIATGGTVSATGTVTGGNVATGGTITATGTITGGNLATSGTVTATGTVTGGNVLTGGVVSATSNVTGGNLITGGYVTATGTVYSGNVLTPGEVSAGGSLTGGNIFTGGQISAVSTITGGNVATAGFVSATGNITGGNIVSVGQISSTGNITAPTFLGNLQGTTSSVTGNVQGGNILFGTGIVSGTGNIYANKIFANIVGNVDAAGNLYEVQFNTTGDQLGATANFTYNFDNNVFTVANGNIAGGNLLINNNINANGNITTGGFVSSVGNVIAPWFIGNVNATTLSALGNIVGGNIDAVGLLTAGNISTAGNVNSGNILNSGTISSVGNVTAPWFIGNVNATTVSASGNIDAGNLLIAGIVSSTGNVTAPTFIGNLIGNITGNIDAGGANTEIQFNDADILAGSAAFTFNKTSNLVTVTGNITAGNVASQGIITANLGVYGDIYTTSIDSADSSAIIVTPDMILLSSLDVNQDITVGNIVIPSSGNITVGNVRIANLADPVFNQDAVTKRYVDSAIGNVLPIITNQTIDPDGSSLTYTLDQSTTAVGVLVTINGISQTPNDSYSVLGNTITFAETLLTSDIVQIRFLSGTAGTGIIYTVDTLPLATAAGPGARAFVNDANTTVFYSNIGNNGSNFVPVFSDGTTWRVG